MIKLELLIKENKNENNCKCTVELKEQKTTSEIEKICGLALKELISKTLIEKEREERI